MHIHAVKTRVYTSGAEFDAFSYGFSNRTWPETLQILHSYGIECLVDIRSLPASRKFPQFDLENLREQLPAAGIEYEHLKALGGLRKTDPRSGINAGWHNESFRAYADYMQTAEFEEGLEELIRLLKEKRTAYACTEAVFWRCHRSLVSDALLARGFTPVHIFDATKHQAHRLTTFAEVDGLRVSYPAPSGLVSSGG